MAELIVTIILIGSFLGMTVILLRKIPVLVKLPEVTEEVQTPLVLRIKKIIKNLPILRNFSYEIFLQKLLSRIRILTLKTENKTNGWLERLRRRHDQKNNQNNHGDNYWEELKKAKNGE